jgi:serine phosphatase RsbU (regulator of sigma subunit)
VVGGDFYWFHQKAEKTYLLLGDCTGHGVSGAFMSLISTSLLDRIANEGKITDPAGMLSELGRLIQQALGQDRPGSPSDDGLDAAVCSFDAQTNTLTFSGVVLSLYQLKGGAVEEIWGDKQSVGYKASAGEQPFTNHTLTFEAGTRFSC